MESSWTETSTTSAHLAYQSRPDSPGITQSLRLQCPHALLTSPLIRTSQYRELHCSSLYNPTILFTSPFLYLCPLAWRLCLAPSLPFLSPLSLHGPESWWFWTVQFLLASGYVLPFMHNKLSLPSYLGAVIFLSFFNSFFLQEPVWLFCFQWDTLSSSIMLYYLFVETTTSLKCLALLTLSKVDS